MRGIYVIICQANSVVYVGYSTCVNKRWKTHRSELNAGIKDNPYLQNAWNKYGEAAFEFKTLIEMPRATTKELKDAETVCIRLLEPTFNMVKDTSASPTQLPSVRAKISKANKGKRRSPETRAKISLAMKGRKHTSEHRDNHIGMKGRKHTPETKAKISAAKKGRPWSEARRRTQEGPHDMG